MHDSLLKLTFCIGFLLIIFHSTIFHFVGQNDPHPPSQKSNHVTNQQVRQPKNLIDDTLTSKVNNKTRKALQVIKRTSTYKNTKTKSFTQPVIPKRKNVQELSDQYIETVLNKQKRFFKTCYMHHLKNNFASKGSIILSFNINSPGRVSDVSIQGGSIKDVLLHKCMKKVVERVTFSHFSGPLTKVFYPIEFH